MRHIETILNRIPDGRSGRELTPGCLVLEGGAFRGLYTGGVTDTLLLNNINIQTVIGVSAGALTGPATVQEESDGQAGSTSPTAEIRAMPGFAPFEKIRV